MKRFNRFELKYLVTLKQAQSVREDLLKHMQVDPQGEDGSYAVTSVYYDTPDLAFMRSKRDGIKYRRKVRVRRYGVQETESLWVEIKQRINRTTQKRRLQLAPEKALALCAGERPSGLMPEDEDVASEILYLVRTLTLQPTCLVGYDREALVGGDYESGLRVTFDRDIWTAIPDQQVAVPSHRHSLIGPTGVVMEVKANDRVPLWLANLLTRHECPLRRYSKYCNGVEKLAELSLLALPETDSAMKRWEAGAWTN